MAFKPTMPQQNAIDANGTVLVSAAAGSGKTAVLVERVMKRFCDEETPLMANRALIVTFTNAAAAELKIKIESKLQEKLSNNPKSALLRRQSMLIKSAKICTIDSFCISLVKEYFNLLDISADFKTTDSSELIEDYKEILENIFKEKHNCNDSNFEFLLDSLQSGYDDYYLKEIIQTLYNKSCSMPYQEKWLDGLKEQYKYASKNFNKSQWVSLICKSIIDDANYAYRDACELKAEAIADNTFYSKYEAQLLARVDFAKGIKDGLNNNDWQKVYEILQSFSADSLRKNSSKNPIISSYIVRSKNTQKALVDKLNDYFMFNQETAINSLKKFEKIFSLISEIVKIYISKIHENSLQKNVFTFDQIEHMALKLLTEHSDIVTENFNLNYDAILVDEYQDTNNLQDEIFNILSAQKKELFMVGDVKQSIYGFRNANPDNFLARKDDYAAYNVGSKESKILLSGNFRSRRGVCDFVNYIFKAYMTKDDADMDYSEDEELVPLGKYPDNSEEAVEIYLTEPEESQSNSEAEANLIADYIEETLKKDPFLKDENDGLRKANLNDFCILMRSPKNKIRDYVEVFKSRGIPVSTPAQKFSESVEVIAAISMLKVVDNFNDSLSLVALLKTPIFNFTEDEIAKIRIHNKKVPLFLNIKLAANNGDAKAKKVYDFLVVASRLSAVLTVDKLLTKLFSMCGFVEVYSSLSGGEMRKANLRLLIEKAISFNYGDNGISEFVQYIESDSNKALSANITSSDKSVQIMSIHNSKGLQFPICIICGLNGKFNLRDAQNKIVSDDNLGIAFDYNDLNIGSTIVPISKLAIKHATINKTYKEELRLLYVALTRACEKLVLVTSVKNIDSFLEKVTEISSNNARRELPFNKNALFSCSNYAEWIFSALICHKNGIKLKRGETLVTTVNNDCGFAVNLYSSKTIKSKNETKVDNSYSVDFGIKFQYKYPYLSLNKVPAKTSVTDILGKSSSAELVYRKKPGFLQEQGYTSAEKGTATHKFMEFCDYGAAANDVEREIERLYEWQYISQAEAQAIDKDSINAFFNSYLYALILKAKTTHKEYRFLTKIKASLISNDISDDNEYSVVQGVADCVIENEDEIIIVDFKTDKTDNESALRNQYNKQLSLYAKALEEIFNKPVTKKIIYSFHLKKCIEV